MRLFWVNGTFRRSKVGKIITPLFTTRFMSCIAFTQVLK